MRGTPRAGAVRLQDEAGAVFSAVNGDFGPPLLSPEETGAHRIKAKLAFASASRRFRNHVPLSRGPVAEADLVSAAEDLLAPLGVHPSAWREACELVGPYPAALCVLIADRAAAERDIVSVGGYLRGMVRKALSGALNIDRSIFGLLEG